MINEIRAPRVIAGLRDVRYLVLGMQSDGLTTYRENDCQALVLGHKLFFLFGILWKL